MVKSKLNGSLPIRIALGRDRLDVSVLKKGPGAKALTEKSALIAEYLRDRISLQYIPTVRTAKSSHEVVDRMLENELQAVEADPAYTAALDQIARLQEPVLKRISASIKSTLVQFLPAIRDVDVRIASQARIEALRRSSEIIVDDGTPTQLRHKGDGVQSLAALALKRHSSDSGPRARHAIIAVEEPESHLHPNAVHGLREVLRELAQKQQIVITTHCPLFVDRSSISANILVNDSKARSAKNIGEIRQILGVRASDNLRHAELVVIVAGSEDQMVMESLLRVSSPKLTDALNEGMIAFETLGGASNLVYKVGLIQAALCACHCFLDDDKAGRTAFDKARRQGLLTDADVTFSICAGMQESEIEDLLDPAIYESVILHKYRVSLQSSKFHTSKKWSDRMSETFRNQGKPWDDRIEADVKRCVAEATASNPAQALNPHKRSAFDALATVLVTRLDEVKQF